MINFNADFNIDTNEQKMDIVSAESDTLALSMRQKASQLVKNAMDNVKRDRKSEKEKKLPEREEKNKFKDLYNMVMLLNPLLRFFHKNIVRTLLLLNGIIFLCLLVLN